MKSLARDQELRQKIVDLHRIFYFGMDITPLETFIENKYIEIKMNKKQMYSMSKKNKYHCIFSLSDSRRADEMYNFRQRDLDLYDDFQPMFEPRLDHIEFADILQISFELDNLGWFNKKASQYQNRNRTRRSQEYFFGWGSQLASRIRDHVTSNEFMESKLSSSSYQSSYWQL